MRTVDDCLKAAYQALLNGDRIERDRQCKMADHILWQQEQIKNGHINAVLGEPIIIQQESKVSRAARG